ncbi:hypothetical protein B0H15DRAFT_988753 [Mycena belliarum]|uniref:Pyruvate decarboxylase n=1 Tax=Mycena belliarum TaxID=1033014 RepID=A0AAD6TZR1_9AGAR|nr:hypothetical protein B0H15DRAFT_988753 [Mycena belliae]
MGVTFPSPSSHNDVPTPRPPCSQCRSSNLRIGGHPHLPTGVSLPAAAYFPRMQLQLGNDDKLGKPLGSVVIPQGGLVPHIDPLLLPTAQIGKGTPKTCTHEDLRLLRGARARDHARPARASGTWRAAHGEAALARATGDRAAREEAERREILRLARTQGPADAALITELTSSARPAELARPSGLTSASRQSLDTYTSTPTEPPRRPTTPVTATPAEYDGSPSIGPPQSAPSPSPCTPGTALRPSRLSAIRRISRSTAFGAAPAPPVRPVASPTFQQVPPATAAPTPAPHNYGPPPHEPLDHSFIGLTGGEIFHEMMLRHDVKHIFGYPGGAILPSSTPSTTRSTLTSSSRATNRVLAIWQRATPVATSAISSDAFQEADIVGISRSCIQNRHLWSPGPVLVDLPKDVTAMVLRAALPFKQTTPGHGALAAALINPAAGRPLRPRGPELLAQLSENGNIPVCTTLQGLGTFDEMHPNSLHMLGMHGSAYANIAMQQADVIIALGGRFDDRVTGKIDTFAPAARAAALQGRGGITHFEILPKNINKVVEATIPQSPPAWFADIAKWKAQYPFTYDPSKEGTRMKPPEVIEALTRDARAARRTSSFPPASASTRCGPRSTIGGYTRSRWSPPVVSGQWVSDYLQLSAPRSPRRTAHRYQRGLERLEPPPHDRADLRCGTGGTTRSSCLQSERRDVPPMARVRAVLKDVALFVSPVRQLARRLYLGSLDATQKLENASRDNASRDSYPEHMVMFSSVLVDESSAIHVRNAAGLALKRRIECPRNVASPKRFPFDAGSLPTKGGHFCIDMMTDTNADVKDTTAWTLGRICDLLPQTIKPDVHLHPDDSSPRRSLGASDSEDDEPVQTGPLSPYCDSVVQALLPVTENVTNEHNSRTAAYEAIAAYLSGPPSTRSW